jgi:dephospho-CoA kinase
VSRRFLLVGLTGGIASGKSLVSAIFKELGARVIDADQLAREVVAPGQPAYREIVEAFGEEILGPDGRLDRKKLGASVFADPGRRRRLEAVTHPRIQALREARLRALADQGFEGIVIQDAALLIEVGGIQAVDRLVVVYVDEATERERLMARDGLSEAEARQRIASQMPLQEKARLAHYVVDNGGSPEETRRQVQAIYQALEADRRSRFGGGS